jgi:hypothetical protein
VIQYPDTTVTIDLVAIERKVHFLDAMPLGARTEMCLGSGCTTTEENAVARLHVGMIHAIIIQREYSPPMACR